MSEPIIIATATLMAIAIIAIVALRGWQGWLTFKERELVQSPSPRREIEGGAGALNYGGTARIEIADLKERIRKLEAIASGVDP